MGTVTHTETEEALVLYWPLAEPHRLFVRPWAMFFEDVTPGVPRFTRLTDISE